MSTYGRWLKKRAPGALDRLDLPMNSERGSKVVAEMGYPLHPQGGQSWQLTEIPWKSVEPATRIEPATCGLRIPDLLNGLFVDCPTVEPETQDQPDKEAE